MLGKIYKIKNLINSKLYIGQTTCSLEQRWKEHLNEAKRNRAVNRPLYRAIRKYGAENFIIELVEEVELSQLNIKEIYWIGYFHSYENGYNATLGGDGTICYDYNKIESLIKEGKTTKEIIKIIGCSSDVVRKIAKIKGIELEQPKKSLQNKMKEGKISVDQYDLKEKFLQTFESYAEAARWLEKNGYVKGNLSGVRTKIGEVCTGKRKTAYKFKWKKHSCR
jgi:group I intron endonuclease